MFFPPDPMATALGYSDREIAYRLRTGLSQVPRVISAFVLRADQVLSVWVAIADDDHVARKNVYKFDDELSERFPQMIFDFHVVPVPPGRKLEDFVSAAERVI